ncbi:MAG TPA: chorismate-binding protein, partial [Bordetella sp.]|nr:chorismate-binding protein [Bordetella sp.]
MQCRFEDRLAGQALCLHDPLQHIEARQSHQLPAALDAIEAARRAGHWIALLLDYELGEWLAPETTLAPPGGMAAPARPDADAPRLTALVYGRAAIEPPWPAPDAGTDAARILSVQPRLARADYLRQVEHIRGLIAAGDLYQVNHTQPLDVRMQGDWQQLYRRIAARHPVAHGACIDDGVRRVLSFSPELFVRRDGARLTVRPMKGTAPRHPDPAEDARLGREL